MYPAACAFHSFATLADAGAGSVSKVFQKGAWALASGLHFRRQGAIYEPSGAPSESWDGGTARTCRNGGSQAGALG
jgi:hypothetical protein